MTANAGERRRPQGLPYSTVHDLLREEPYEEDDPTARLIARLRHVKRAGEFSRAEFLEMCRWKSPRPLRHYRRNPAAAVRAISREVLASRNERQRLDLLRRLHGVSVPVASAILTLIDPRRYGVIDIRVWKLLYALGAVGWKPGGQGFTFRDWDHYLATLRHHARERGVPVRAVEYTLFCCHRKHHEGRLYERRGR